MEEIISAFPEGKQIIPVKIVEWNVVLDKTVERISDKLRAAKLETDESNYWFPREIIKVTDGPVLVEADKHITRLKFLQSAYAGNKNRSGVSEDDIASASEVPIEQLYEGKLRRSGKNLVGLCPFHNERHGSFYIYTESNSFHCFGCQAGGDAIEYVKQLYNLTFVETVKQLLNY